MATRAGPNMKRVTLPDGEEILLPEDAKLAEPYPADGTEAEQAAWMEKHFNEPLSGTY